MQALSEVQRVIKLQKTFFSNEVLTCLHSHIHSHTSIFFIFVHHLLVHATKSTHCVCVCFYMVLLSQVRKHFHIKAVYAILQIFSMQIF